MMRIDEYKFGKIVINGVLYESTNIVIFPDHVDTNWWMKEGHKLTLDDLREVLKYRPQVIVIGTGAYGLVKVSGNIISSLESKGIKVIVKRTDEACKEFNKLLSKGVSVIAALHLTC